MNQFIWLLWPVLLLKSRITRAAPRCATIRIPRICELDCVLLLRPGNMKSLAYAVLLSLAVVAPAVVSHPAAEAGKPATSRRKATRADRRKAIAALIRAVPKTKVRQRLVGGTAFLVALRAEQARLETSRRGPDAVAPELQAEIRQRVLGLDRLLERQGPDYLLNVPTHGEVARIRDSLRALLD